LQLPLDTTSATLAGVPEMAGKPLGKQGWGVLNQALQAGGFHVVDMGKNGPDGGMWVVNKGGEKIVGGSDGVEVAMEMQIDFGAGLLLDETWICHRQSTPKADFPSAPNSR